MELGKIITQKFVEYNGKKPNHVQIQIIKFFVEAYLQGYGDGLQASYDK